MLEETALITKSENMLTIRLLARGLSENLKPTADKLLGFA